MSITNIGGGKGSGGKGSGESGEVILMPDEFENTTEASKYIKLDTAKFLTKTEAPNLWELLSFGATYYIKDTASIATTSKVFKVSEYIYCRLISNTELQFSETLDFAAYESWTGGYDSTIFQYISTINSDSKFIIFKSQNFVLIECDKTATDLTTFMLNIISSQFISSDTNYSFIVSITKDYIITQSDVTVSTLHKCLISDFQNLITNSSVVQRIYTSDSNYECAFLENNYFIERGSIVNLDTEQRTTLTISDYGDSNHYYFSKDNFSIFTAKGVGTWKIKANDTFTALDIAYEDAINFYVYDYIDDANLISGSNLELLYKYENGTKSNIDTLLLNTKVSFFDTTAIKNFLTWSTSFNRFGSSFLTYDYNNNIVYEIDYSTEKPETFKIDPVVSEHDGYSYFMKIE